MNCRWSERVGALVIGASLWVTDSSVTAQSAGPSGNANSTVAWKAPRTADGQPNLQGVWDFRNVIPLERPARFADKAFLTDEEIAEYEQEAAHRLDMDRRDDDPNRTPPVVNGQRATADVARAYNEFWWDYGKKFVGAKRSSLIVDPPDGKLPPLTAKGRKAADDFAGRRARAAWGPEDRGVGERCILGFNAGPPFLPAAYNNNIQVFQTRDHVVILNEMVHNARIVSLDSRPHLKFPQWSGSSRGRWEGATLVVETVNFYDTTSFANSSPTMRLVEKFTRVEPDLLMYEFTVSDPTTWTRPFTAQLPMKKTGDKMYEYACHEGNYGMTGLLSGARAIEAVGGLTATSSK